MLNLANSIYCLKSLFLLSVLFWVVSCILCFGSVGGVLSECRASVKREQFGFFKSFVVHSSTSSIYIVKEVCGSHTDYCDKNSSLLCVPSFLARFKQASPLYTSPLISLLYSPLLALFRGFPLVFLPCGCRLCVSAWHRGFEGVRVSRKKLTLFIFNYVLTFGKRKKHKSPIFSASCHFLQFQKCNFYPFLFFFFFLFFLSPFSLNLGGISV